MGSVGGISGNNGAMPYQQQDQSLMMGFALMSAFMSNDPRQMMGAFATLAAMDPRQFLMMLGAMNPQLFNQLAQTMGAQQAGGGCSCGAANGVGGNQAGNPYGNMLAEMLTQGMNGNRQQQNDAHVVPPRNRNQSFQRPRTANEKNIPTDQLPGSTDGRPVTGAAVYPPNSPEAVNLFREAARVAGVPESWATSRGLHNILARESGGVVGRPNYTYGSRANNRSQWDSIHNELKNGRITARSSATGLGQLLLSNVDRYYPNGRAGIGDPVQEAAGMLRYIQSRYGNPENAWARYGTRHEGY